MTEEMTTEQYENRIKELENQLKEAEANTGFDEIKAKYEEIISQKDKEIKELEQTVDQTKNQINETVDELTQEVDERLKQSQAYKDMEAKLHEMEIQRAEATVDAYIQKGILLPVQKESAIKLCLNDNETFSNLYRDAKPIVETESKRKSIPAGTAERIANYFKK